MNAAHALLREVARDPGAVHLDLELRLAIDDEISRAATAPTPGPADDRTDPDPYGPPTARPPLDVVEYGGQIRDRPIGRPPIFPRDAYLAGQLAGHVDPAVMNDALVDESDEPPFVVDESDTPQRFPLEELPPVLHPEA